MNKNLDKNEKYLIYKKTSLINDSLEEFLIEAKSYNV